MKLKLITVLIVLGFLHIVKAQDSVLVFTIDEAVNYALENNKTVQNSRDDIALADAQCNEARAAGLPQIEGGFDYMTYFNYELSLIEGSGSEYSIADGLAYSVPTVADEADIYLANVLDEFISSLSEPITMGDQVTANVQVTQLIFSGQYWVGFQMAKLAKSVYETSLIKTEQETTEQVMNVYYTILTMEKLLVVVNENIANLEDMYNHTNNMVKVGVAEQTDADELGITLSRLKNAKSEMERNISLTYNMFRVTIGLDSGDEIVLKDSLENIVEKTEIEAQLNGSYNVSQNLNYQLVEKQEELGMKMVNMERSAYLPTAAAYYSYTEKIVSSSFDLTPTNTAGVTVTIPIFNGGEKQAKLSQKKIELDKIQRNKSLLEDQLQMQYNQISYELSSALDNYNLQKENKEVALRLYNNFHNKYKQGYVSSLELTQANSNYLQAETEYYSSILKLLQSKLALDKLNNKI